MNIRTFLYSWNIFWCRYLYIGLLSQFTSIRTLYVVYCEIFKNLNLFLRLYLFSYKALNNTKVGNIWSFTLIQSAIKLLFPLLRPFYIMREIPDLFLTELFYVIITSSVTWLSINSCLPWVTKLKSIEV